MGLGSAGIGWPAFIPVHDSLRDAYRGVSAADGGSVFFETDSVSSNRPKHLLKVTLSIVLSALSLRSAVCFLWACCLLRAKTFNRAYFIGDHSWKYIALARYAGVALKVSSPKDSCKGEGGDIF